jgi:DNA polymerase I-like protein with 3'-5' exonuclease and polymerase domains
MRCQPPAEGLPQAAGGARGTSAAKTSGYRAGIEACRERLAEEVLAYPRTLILTLGNSANRSLLGEFGFKITGKRGTAIDLDEIGVVFPTFHPASILRNQGEWPRWFADLKYAASIYKGGTEAVKRPDKPTAYIILSEPNEAALYPIERLPNPAGIKPKDGDENQRRHWNEDLIDHQAAALRDWPNRVVTSGIPAAVRAVDMLLQMPELSADIETGYSYSPRLGKVIALSVAWSPTEAVVFSEGLLESRGFRPHLKRLLTTPGPLWIGHNFKYDSSYLRWQFLDGEWPKEGAIVNSHDTLLEHYCLDETKGTHALEAVARDLLGAQDYKYVVRKYGLHDKGYENVPREILYSYAALDTTHTLSIHKLLCPKVHADKGLTKLYEQLLLPASRFLESVQDYGLYVDQSFIAVLDKTLGDKVTQAQADLIKTVETIWDTDEYMASRWATKKRPDTYGPRNWKHTSFMLEKLIGWVPMNTNERTLRDLDQTGKDQSATFGYKAKNYARGHPNRKIKLNFPYIQALIDYRLSSHAYNMLVNGIVKTMEPDGRLHTNFQLQATETGRLSSSNPNLQNLPVPEKGDPNPSRNIVGAPPGRVLVEADYQQLELKLLAHFSNDKNLLQVYLDGRDLHTELSIAIWGSGFTNYQRVRAKAVNFGIAYGRGAGSIAAEHDISEAEAEEMRQAWFEHFPQAAQWLAFLHQAPFSGKGRTIITLFGRRRRFGVISRENHSDLKNQSANFPMQSTGSDLTLLSAMRIQQKWDREGTDAHIVCLVHDSLVAECPEDIRERVAAELSAVMEDTPARVLQPKIKFSVDVHIGRAWGTLKVEEMEVLKKGMDDQVSIFGKGVSKESQERARRLTS